jgi:hypothetical protein
MMMMLDQSASIPNVQPRSNNSICQMLPSLPSNGSSSLVIPAATTRPLPTRRIIYIHITAITTITTITTITRSLSHRAQPFTTTRHVGTPPQSAAKRV